MDALCLTFVKKFQKIRNDVEFFEIFMTTVARVFTLSMDYRWFVCDFQFVLSFFQCYKLKSYRYWRTSNTSLSSNFAGIIPRFFYVCIICKWFLFVHVNDNCLSEYEIKTVFNCTNYGFIRYLSTNRVTSSRIHEWFGDFWGYRF